MVLRELSRRLEGYEHNNIAILSNRFSFSNVGMFMEKPFYSIFFTDNEALVSLIYKQSSRNCNVMIMVRNLVLRCLQYNILFRAKHMLAGKRNLLADFFRSLAPSACNNVHAKYQISFSRTTFGQQ